MANLKIFGQRPALSFLGIIALILMPCAAVAVPGVIDGRDARNNIDSLTSQVFWFNNLRDAEDSARQKDKPLLWVHMLGKIDGAT